MPRGAPKGRRCAICQHPQRPNIDRAIATGISRRLIAARFKVSADAAWRHGRAHLTPEIPAALATKVLARERDMRRILLERMPTVETLMPPLHVAKIEHMLDSRTALESPRARSR